MNRYALLKNIASFSRFCGANHLLRSSLGGAGVILMFHRFCRADGAPINIGGTVSDSYLDRLLTHIRKRKIDIVRLCDVHEAIMQKRRFVCLTFDDGYKDNRNIALPVLEKHNAPATIFVPSGVLDRSLNGWWLQIEKRASEAENPQERYASLAYRAMHEPAYLQELNLASDMYDLNDQYFMSAQEIKQIAQNPLIDIGGHTCTHPRLKDLDDTAAYEEISRNKADLEALLENDVPTFAYPYGNADACGERDFRLVEKAGYKVAVTTVERNVSKDEQDLMALPRFGIRGHLEHIPLFDMMDSGIYQHLRKAG